MPPKGTTAANSEASNTATAEKLHGSSSASSTQLNSDSLSSWGGLGSWFSSVSTTASANKTFTQASAKLKQLGEMTTHLITESSTATSKAISDVSKTPAAATISTQWSQLQAAVARGVTTVLDTVAPESNDLKIKLQLHGRVNVPTHQYMTDVQHLISSALSHRGYDVEFLSPDPKSPEKDIWNTVRTFVPEELNDPKLGVMETVWEEAQKVYLLTQF
jgi:hypothetical protein